MGVVREKTVDAMQWDGDAIKANQFFGDSYGLDWRYETGGAGIVFACRDAVGTAVGSARAALGQWVRHEVVGAEYSYQVSDEMPAEVREILAGLSLAPTSAPPDSGAYACSDPCCCDALSVDDEDEPDEEPAAYGAADTSRLELLSLGSTRGAYDTERRLRQLRAEALYYADGRYLASAEGSAQAYRECKALESLARACTELLRAG